MAALINFQNNPNHLVKRPTDNCMKRNLFFLLALTIAAITSTSKATIFFSDGFTNGSTINSGTPANPTPTNTAYEMVSSKAWVPTPTVTANDLKFGIASTTSGSFEIEALFATNVIALTQPGDYIQLAIVFTNTAGVLVGSGALGVGLYNSFQSKPLSAGTNNATTGITLAGFAQNWVGYVGQVSYGAVASRIITRPTQSRSNHSQQPGPRDHRQRQQQLHGSSQCWIYRDSQPDLEYRLYIDGSSLHNDG